jgi:hypothetical protein
VVSFTPQPLYLRRKRPWHPLDRRLTGSQNRSARGKEEKNLTTTGNRTSEPSAVARSKSLYRLHFPGSYYHQKYGRATAQAVSRWLPTAVAWVRYRVWWTKLRWGRFSPSTSVSPANLHSTNCSTVTIIYRLGLVQ